jgi:hypothetical protein
VKRKKRVNRFWVVLIGALLALVGIVIIINNYLAEGVLLSPKECTVSFDSLNFREQTIKGAPEYINILDQSDHKALVDGGCLFSVIDQNFDCADADLNGDCRVNILDQNEMKKNIFCQENIETDVLCSASFELLDLDLSGGVNSADVDEFDRINQNGECMCKTVVDNEACVYLDTDRDGIVKISDRELLKQNLGCVQGEVDLVAIDTLESLRILEMIEEAILGEEIIDPLDLTEGQKIQLRDFGLEYLSGGLGNMVLVNDALYFTGASTYGVSVPERMDLFGFRIDELGSLRDFFITTFDGREEILYARKETPSGDCSMVYGREYKEIENDLECILELAIKDNSNLWPILLFNDETVDLANNYLEEQVNRGNVESFVISQEEGIIELISEIEEVDYVFRVRLDKNHFFSNFPEMEIVVRDMNALVDSIGFTSIEGNDWRYVEENPYLTLTSNVVVAIDAATNEALSKFEKEDMVYRALMRGEGGGAFCGDGVCSIFEDSDSCNKDCPVFLDSCGEPEGGWESGINYALGRSVQVNGDGEYCFEIDRDRVSLDCQEHVISGTSNLNNGILIKSDRGDIDEVGVRNCAFTGVRNAIYAPTEGLSSIGNGFTIERNFINSFSGEGIFIDGGESHIIKGNMITRGGVAELIGTSGIKVDGGEGIEISENTVCLGNDINFDIQISSTQSIGTGNTCNRCEGEICPCSFSCTGQEESEAFAGDGEDVSLSPSGTVGGPNPLGYYGELSGGVPYGEKIAIIEGSSDQRFKGLVSSKLAPLGDFEYVILPPVLIPTNLFGSGFKNEANWERITEIMDDSSIQHVFMQTHGASDGSFQWGCYSTKLEAILSASKKGMEEGVDYVIRKGCPLLIGNLQVVGYFIIVINQEKFYDIHPNNVKAMLWTGQCYGRAIDTFQMRQRFKEIVGGPSVTTSYTFLMLHDVDTFVNYWTGKKPYISPQSGINDYLLSYGEAIPPGILGSIRIFLPSSCGSIYLDSSLWTPTEIANYPDLYDAVLNKGCFDRVGNPVYCIDSGNKGISLAAAPLVGFVNKEYISMSTPIRAEPGTLAPFKPDDLSIESCMADFELAPTADGVFDILLGKLQDNENYQRLSEERKEEEKEHLREWISDNNLPVGKKFIDKPRWRRFGGLYDESDISKSIEWEFTDQIERGIYTFNPLYSGSDDDGWLVDPDIDHYVCADICDRILTREQWWERHELTGVFDEAALTQDERDSWPEEQFIKMNLQGTDVASWPAGFKLNGNSKAKDQGVKKEVLNIHGVPPFQEKIYRRYNGADDYGGNFEAWIPCQKPAILYGT